MPEIKLSLRAKADLQGIWHFIAPENPSAATKVVESAYETFTMLADSPKLGRLRSIATLPKMQVRSWFVTGFKQYLIFYCVTAKGIHVLRVYHASRDIESLLGK